MANSLSPAQHAALDAAGARFDVDPRLIEAVWGKESSFGTDPNAASDWFDQFGLIAGPGKYNGYGYNAQGNTFSDAVDTVAAFFHYERGNYDTQHTAGESFLQYSDAVYSPPASNPDSLGNLQKIYAQLGGDVAGEAHFSPAQSDPMQLLNQNAAKTGASVGNGIDGVAKAINNFTVSAQDIAMTVGFGAIGLALLAAGGVILASSNSAVQTAAKGALLA